MQERVLMPFQEHAFNADTYIQDEFLILRDRFNIKTVIETGTAYGYTTLWLAANFEKVYTIELNKEYCEIARAKFLLQPNITSIHGNSADVLRHLRIEGNAILFADAHWNNQCPLLNELYAISKMNIKPVIAIHDFQVPGSLLGFDAYKGQPFNLKWITGQLNNIYGVNGWAYHYNSDEKSKGARRGIIYIYKK